MKPEPADDKPGRSKVETLHRWAVAGAVTTVSYTLGCVWLAVPFDYPDDLSFALFVTWLMLIAGTIALWMWWDWEH